MYGQRELLQEKFKRIANLPTLPEVASRLMRMVDDPLSSTNDVAAIIGQDVSLSSKVLRLANSAFYGMPGKITNIHYAVVLLGFKVITTIVLSVSVFDMFPECKRSKKLFDRKAFWLHSLGCGLMAKRLAQLVKKRFLFDPEEAFCAGLLHDIGKVALEQYLHEEFHASLQAARKKRIPLFVAEKEVLGCSHADVAAWLTAPWGLPAEIQKPLAFHHDPSAPGDGFDTAGLCHAADWLCYESGLSIDTGYAAPEPVASIVSELDLTPETIRQLKTQTLDELEKSSMFFSIAE